MSRKNPYQPPYTITPAILRLVAEIGEAVGRLSVQSDTGQALHLRRIHRIRTIQGSLAIEGNTLSEEQITAILDGKRVIAPQWDIQEARNAIAAYERFDQWQPYAEEDLLTAHRLLMDGLIDEAGVYRHGVVLSGSAKQHRSDGFRAFYRVYAQNDTGCGFPAGYPPKSSPMSPPMSRNYCKCWWGKCRVMSCKAHSV